MKKPSKKQTARSDATVDQTALDRRRVLGLALATGSAALLAACSSSSRTSRVGEPIPGAPDYQPIAKSATRRRPIGTPNYRVPRENLPSQVTILSRSAWASSGPVLNRANRMGRIRSLTVHHDGMTPYTSTLYDDTARRLESIRRAHVGQGWADIGYHYAVDPAGRVWACRPESLQGAHVKDYNPGNIGILVLGNYEKQRPTTATKRTLDTLIASQIDAHRLTVSDVHTHREWARTACPGRHLQAHMQSARASGGSINSTIALLAAL